MSKRITLYVGLHDTCGRAYIGSSMFNSEAEARRHASTMPAFYREQGEHREASAWERGRHAVVPVEVEIPDGWEVSLC